jgi:hypothetical protein
MDKYPMHDYKRLATLNGRYIMKTRQKLTNAVKKIVDLKRDIDMAQPGDFDSRLYFIGLSRGIQKSLDEIYKEFPELKE